MCHAVKPTVEYIYYGAYGRRQTRLSGMVRIVATRWAIGEGLKRAKGGVELDQYEAAKVVISSFNGLWPSGISRIRFDAVGSRSGIYS